jgi:AGZA family xanthine/uracil permease-like MFS transporter
MSATKGNAQRLPLLVRSDVDGFLGLALDNLIQFLLILSLCAAVLGFDRELILGTILPGAALSLVIGNVYYTWQARRLARAAGRTDITALPYGINTVSLFAYVFLVMLPVKAAALSDGATEAAAARIAWQVGLCACLVSGLVELLGSLVAERVRRATPRAALLSTLSGIAISFIAIDFALRSFEIPLVAFLPLVVILATYFAGVKLPLGLPGGLWAVALGTAAAWLCHAAGQPSPVSVEALRGAQEWHVSVPVPVLGDLLEGIRHLAHLEGVRTMAISVMLPMGLFNVLGSLQNIESAEAAGDPFPTRPSLAVNGIGSVIAAAFGSCFPTTIYIGHPGWKAMGARSGYSLLNGVVFALIAVLGVIGFIAELIPLEAGMAIVLYIGLVITAQAFQATPREHAPAVAVGLFPAIAAWGALMFQMALLGAGTALSEPLGKPGFEVFADVVDSGIYPAMDVHLPGLVALGAGFMLTCMIWSSITAHLIDHRPGAALVWALLGAAFAIGGFIHAGQMTSAGIVQTIGPRAGAWPGWPWAAGYLLVAAFLGILALSARRESDVAPPAG